MTLRAPGPQRGLDHLVVPKGKYYIPNSESSTIQGVLMDADEAGRVFTDPSAYADDRRFHAACTTA